MAKTTCVDDGCGKPALARGMCVTHYHRWIRATKEARPPVGICRGCGTQVPKAPGPPRHYCSPDCRPRCEVQGCEKPQHGNTYCNAHHTRWKRTGDPLTPLTRFPNVGECVVDGCDQPMRKREWCSDHYTMWRRHGEIREFTYRWGDGGYGPTHAWIRRSLGRPEEHVCIDCGSTAEEWSYDNLDPDELRDARHDNATYTRKLEHYDPRCVPCHRAFDRDHRRQNVNVP